MKDSIFWLLFWIIVFTYYGSVSYFEEKTKQIKINADLKIQEMKLKQENVLNESISKLIKSNYK